MNEHLDAAFDISNQIEAILYAINETFMEYADSHLQNLVYTMTDLTNKLIEELDRLAKEQRLV